jgi:hypothetical protein
MKNPNGNTIMGKPINMCSLIHCDFRVVGNLESIRLMFEKVL